MDKINEKIFKSNIELVDKNKVLEQDKKILQKRINRAIEKLEYYNSGEATYYVPIEEIIKILKGRYVENE